MLRLVLLISLAFNLILAGAVAGYVYGDPRLASLLPPQLRPEHRKHPGHALSEAAEEAFAPETARRLQEEMRKARRTAHLRKREIRKSRRRIRALLAADSFDKAAIQAESANMQQARAQIGQAFTDALTNAAENMTAEERRILTELLPRKGKDGPRRAPESPPADRDIPEEAPDAESREGAPPSEPAAPFEPETAGERQPSIPSSESTPAQEATDTPPEMP